MLIIVNNAPKVLIKYHNIKRLYVNQHNEFRTIDHLVKFVYYIYIYIQINTDEHIPGMFWVYLIYLSKS